MCSSAWRKRGFGEVKNLFFLVFFAKNVYGIIRVYFGGPECTKSQDSIDVCTPLP